MSHDLVYKGLTTLATVCYDTGMDKIYHDRADSIQARLTQLRDSL
jgi:hypothetical protein